METIYILYRTYVGYDFEYPTILAVSNSIEELKKTAEEDPGFGINDLDYIITHPHHDWDLAYYSEEHKWISEEDMDR